MGLAIISSLLPVALKGIVSLVDRIKGNGTGAEKKPLAVELLKSLFESLQKSTPGVGLPQSDQEIGGMVEQTVGELNAAGKLKGYATIVDADVDAAMAELVATFLESQARRFRALAKGIA